MTSSLELLSKRGPRKVAFDWRYGTLPARFVMIAVFVAALATAASSWQAVRGERQAERLSGRLVKFEYARSASTFAIQAADAPDIVQSLPAAPDVTQVVQTLQRAADKEGARIMSLQAEDHASTTSALGHLDLTLSVKAPYPSILIVIQQVLDRYPGATLRQILVTPVVSAQLAGPASAVPTATGASSAQPIIESEAHVTLAFWRPPLGIDAAAQAVTGQRSPPAEVTVASAAGSAMPAAPTGIRVLPIASTSSPGATALPPIIGVPSVPRP